MLNCKLSSIYQKNNLNNNQIKMKNLKLEYNKNNKINLVQEQTKNSKDQVLDHHRTILIIDANQIIYIYIVIIQNL